MRGLFALLGFLLSGGIIFILLLVGAFWGFSHLVRHKISSYERSQTESHNEFVYQLIQILVQIAKIDGRVSREEINVIENFFRVHLRYNYDQMLWVKELVKEAQQSQVTLDSLLANFKVKFAYEPRLILVELIYQVVYSGEKRIEPELELARKIANYLEITQYDQQTILSRYTQRAKQGLSEEAHCLEVLGLQADSSSAEIKKAYYKLSMKYHPDKVAHLGDEFKRVAEEKMKEINAAYQFLKKIK